MTPQPQHCEHECVCRWCIDEEYCMHPDIPDCIILPCPYDTRTSRPAPLTQNDNGNCLIICRHCGKVTQVQCKEAAQAREDVLEKSIKVIQNRIDCIMMSYDGEKNEAITQRPYAMADGMQECILMLKSLRTGGEPR